jgi:hypothetical protein
LLIKLRFNFPAGCFLFRAWESIVVGVLGSALTLLSLPLFDKMRIDDPVGECCQSLECLLTGRKGPKKNTFSASSFREERKPFRRLIKPSAFLVFSLFIIRFA